MFVPIDAENLVQELWEVYGCSVSLDYAINYLDINPYATVDSFFDWLRSIGVFE